ncbi:MAG: PAS domain S-box protein [Chlorogloeopsis fritschii C42_A2020_084]|nr:PAS domain S-box protein [Chlorogloeopsis fritschii C42_A2020_084]
MFQDLTACQQAYQVLQQAYEELEKRVQGRTSELQQVNEELQTTLEELKITEEELRQQNEELLESHQVIELERQRYRDLFEFAPDGYLVTDNWGNIREANRAAATLLCIQQQRLIGKPLLIFIAEPERKAFRTRLAQLQSVQGWEIYLKPRSGDLFPAMLAVTSIHDEQGQQVGWRWLLRDISLRKQMEQRLQATHDQLEKRVEERTASLEQANRLLQQEIGERQRAEATLRQSEAKYRTLFNSMDEGYGIAEIILNENGEPVDYRMLEVNPQFERLTGLSSEVALSGKTIREIAPELEEHWYQIYGQVGLTGEPVRFEQCAAGWGRWYDVYAFRIDEPEKRHVAILYNEITARKRREANSAFLVEIAEDFSRLSSVEEIIQAVGAKIGAYLNVTTCNFCEVDESCDEVVYLGCWNVEGVPRLPERICLSEQVSEDFLRRVHAGETIVSNNTQTNPVTNAQANAAIGALSFITVPFHKDGEWKYLFSIHDIVPRTWRKDEIELVRELANRTFPRLERARAEAAVAADLRDTQLLRDLSARLISEDNIQVLYNEIVTAAIALMRADAGTVQILDEATQELVLLATQGFDRTMTEHFYRVAASSNLPCGIALSTNVRTFVDFDVPNCADPDGSLRMHVNAGYLSAQSTPLISRSGKPIGMVSTHWHNHHRSSDRELRFLDLLARQAADLIEQRQAELEIRKFVSLADNSADFIGMCDMNFVPFYVNPTGMQMVGLNDTRQYSKIPVREFFFPEDQDFIINEFFPRVLREGRAEVEIRFRHFQTKEALWMLYSVVCIKDTNDQLIGLATVSRNITDRKLAQEKIKEQAALLDVTTDAIFVRDLECRVLYWNSGAERLYGWQAAEVLGKNCCDFLYKQISPSVEEALKTVVEQGEWHSELNKITKSGQEIVVETSWTLMRDEAGKPKSILSVDTNITEKKQLQAQFYRAQRLESLGTLASGIAHDLNNILTPILTVAQLLPLKFPNLDEKNRQLLTILEDNSKRGAELVKQITAFARGAEGKRVPLQPRHLLKEIEQVVKSTFPKSIEICIHIPTPNLWTVLADPTQIHQVLMNLCVNARDAMPNGGTLSISAQNFHVDENYARMNLEAKEGNYVLITVSDTGCGMAPELLERIFEPFFITKEPGQGTGLGLSTLIGIIKNHGGFVKVYSEVGKGSQFQVYLSAIDTLATQETDDSQMVRGNGELILVVDDEAYIREITKTSLEDFNYRVLIASDGTGAFSLYAQYKNEITLVLIDIQMPSIDGFQAIRILQKMNPSIKIIAFSGLASNQKLLEASGINVQAFLSKPYTIKKLLDTIKEVLSVPICNKLRKSRNCQG